jgi:streptomycin 6-kinase
MNAHEYYFLVRVEAEAQARRRFPRKRQRAVRADRRIEVPEALVAWHHRFFGAAGRPWIDALPDLAADLLDRWQLRVDGAPTCGAVALVLPVLDADGTPGVLKLQPVDDETVGEPIALRAWNGRGAVRLLRHDPASGSMLLERLDSRSLGTVDDDLAALKILSQLLSRLCAVPAPAGLRRLADVGAELLDRVPAALALVSDPVERRLLDRCVGALRELLPEPGDRLLHWDLHFDNVLAACPRTYDSDEREPWLAIDPKPLAGDPGFELLAALHNRWSDVVATGDVPRAVRRRFDLMTETLGLDRQRAAGWTLVRVLQNALWDMENATTSWHTEPDRAVARALLDL